MARRAAWARSLAMCGKNYLMDWIYLSPHFDDVALSCGGLVWEQARAGQAVEIWTICAGDPGPRPLSEFALRLHARWGSGAEGVEIRRAEDLRSCQALEAQPRHFSLPDCIYRTAPPTEPPFGAPPSEAPPSEAPPLYTSEQAILGPIHPLETGLVQSLRRELGLVLPARANLVSPLGLGGHVDHRLARAAAETLDRPLWYYADYPYVLGWVEEASQVTAGMEAVSFPVSPAALEAWEAAVAAHASQISTFWSDGEAMRAALHDYYHRSGSFQLWRNPNLP
ncbi:MAG TPA: PIG-L family deacetylase [Anaerolineales bacterium]|nr:PIG-L family deacetylase [Anaerolineales bacterium]